uniref:Expressed protein n=1 Tax=Echinococcus granulosus TaxID=6210 RepID=A0A068WFT9_ECHGR|nr:expressed protein [Echinococcus granulosus]
MLPDPDPSKMTFRARFNSLCGLDLSMYMSSLLVRLALFGTPKNSSTSFPVMSAVTLTTFTPSRD